MSDKLSDLAKGKTKPEAALVAKVAAAEQLRVPVKDYYWPLAGLSSFSFILMLFGCSLLSLPGIHVTTASIWLALAMGSAVAACFLYTRHSSSRPNENPGLITLAALLAGLLSLEAMVRREMLVASSLRHDLKEIESHTKRQLEDLRFKSNLERIRLGLPTVPAD